MSDSRYAVLPLTVWTSNFARVRGPTPRELATFDNYSTLNVQDEKAKGIEEQAMSTVICTALANIAKKSGRTVKVVAHSSDSQDCAKGVKPDLAVYWRAAGDGTAPWALDTVEASTVSGAQKPHVARCAWAWMNIAIVIERKEAEAGFNFSNQDEGQLLRDSKRGRKARAEHAAVVKEIMLRQHRTHAFTVYICDHWARAFRWDRNGAVVTEAIDLRERLDLFNALMFRLLHLDDKQLGYDTTAQLADVDDIKKLEMYEPPQRGFVHLQRHRNLITENQREYPIYKVECKIIQKANTRGGAISSASKAFLIGRHIADHDSLIGRATRGFIAYDIAEDRLCFLKDQWRSDEDGTHLELETYRRLKANDVSFVATAIAGGDVGELRRPQRTISQRYLNSKKCSGPAERTHTRLVIHEVGRPLLDYAHSPELICVCTHALLGHKDAWEKAGILHCDISAGNIMINVDTTPDKPLGILVDWDMCKYKEDLLLDARTPRATGVSGTWPFLSSLSLLYPRKPREIADDQESFIYVLVYCAFRFHAHSLSSIAQKDDPEAVRIAANKANASLLSKVNGFFYADFTTSDGSYYVGKIKHDIIQSGKPPVHLHDQRSPLALLLCNLFKLLKKHYRTVDEEELEAYKLPHFRRPPLEKPKSNSCDAGSPRFLDPFESYRGNMDFKSLEVSADSSETSSVWSQDGRPLDTHDEFCALFHSALEDEREHGRRIDLAAYSEDRLFDQFDHLNPVTHSGWEGESLASMSTQSGPGTYDIANSGFGGGKKRPADSNPAEEMPTANPAQKRARHQASDGEAAVEYHWRPVHGIQINFDDVRKRAREEALEARKQEEKREKEEQEEERQEREEQTAASQRVTHNMARQKALRANKVGRKA